MNVAIFKQNAHNYRLLSYSVFYRTEYKILSVFEEINFFFLLNNVVLNSGAYIIILNKVNAK